MRFHKVIKHRKAEAKIYGKSKSYPFYRVAGHSAGCFLQQLRLYVASGNRLALTCAEAWQN